METSSTIRFKYKLGLEVKLSFRGEIKYGIIEKLGFNKDGVIYYVANPINNDIDFWIEEKYVSEVK